MNSFRHAFCFLLTVAYLSADAQPIIDSSNNPSIGDSWTGVFGEAVTFDLGSAGADQTWDFSNLSDAEITEEVSVDILDPSTSSFNGQFPEATMINQLTVGGLPTEQFITPTETGIIEYGAVVLGGLFVDVNDPPLEDIIYPITYETSLNTVEVLGTDTDSTFLFADAYGSITTPVGEYDNVLRIQEIYKGYQGGELSFIDTTYLWMQPGNFYPVLAMTSEDDDSGGRLISFLYTSANQATNVTTQLSSELVEMNILGNPVQSDLSVNLNITEPLSNANIRVIDAFGRVIQNMDVDSSVGDSNYNLDLSHIAKGVYWLQLNTQEGVLTKAFMKQ